MSFEKFTYPHLSSWSDELFQKIKVKDEEIKKMNLDMNQLEELNTSKKSEILSLEKTMENTLDNVEKYIEQYSNSIIEKIEKIKKNKYENVSNRSEALFSLYKDLYQDSQMFFSKKEFNYVPSTLKIDINDKIINWLTSLFEEENYDGWTDILTPIWSIEHQYIDMKEKYNVLTKVYKDIEKKYEKKKKVYDNLIDELEKMKKELEALKEFSEKIKECRSTSKNSEQLEEKN